MWVLAKSVGRYLVKAVSSLSVLDFRCVLIRTQFCSLSGLLVFTVLVRSAFSSVVFRPAATVAHDRVGGAEVEGVLSCARRHRISSRSSAFWVFKFSCSDLSSARLVLTS